MSSGDDYDKAYLKALRARMFPAGTPDAGPPPRHVVRSEGRAVGPGRIDYGERFRDFARRLFDADYRALNPVSHAEIQPDN